MTKIVEDKAGLTELYLKSSKPVKDEDFKAQFDLKHLKQRDIEKLLAMFRSHMKAFSQHQCNLGSSKDIKLKVPVTTEEQSYPEICPHPTQCQNTSQTHPGSNAGIQHHQRMQ